MKLNMYIIKDYVKNIVLNEAIESDILSCRLEMPIHFVPGEIMRSDRVYVMTAADYFMYGPFDAGKSIIVAPSARLSEEERKELENRYRAEKADLLFTTEAVSLYSLFNEVISVFRKFAKWSEKLLLCSLRKDPIQAAGDIGTELLENPAALYSSSFYMIRGFDRGLIYDSSRYTQKTGSYMSIDELDEILYDKEYIETWQIDTPSYYPSESDEEDRCIFYNLCISGKKVARYVVGEDCRKFRRSDFPIIQEIGKTMMHLLSMGKVSFALSTHPPFLDETLQILLHGDKNLNMEKLENALASLGWDKEDKYLCVVIFSFFDQLIGSAVNACFRLEKQIPGTIAVTEEKNIVMIANLTRINKTRREVIHVLAEQLKEYMLKAGVSCTFRGLEKLSIFFQQAQIASYIGMQKNGSSWYYLFEEYALDYCIAKISEGLLTESLFPPGMNELLQYDSVNNKEYTKVLRVYLEHDRSIVASIKELFISRATFLYQLNRIQEITGFNLNDPNLRLLLRILFRVMDKDTGCQ